MTGKHLFTALLIVFASIFMTATVAAHNLPTDEAETDNVDSRADIEDFLASGAFMVSRTELGEIDSDPVPELVAIATSRRTKSFIKERAIKCLSLYRDARVQKAFTKLIGKRPGRHFNVTVMAYLEAFGEDAVDDVAPFLKHRKPEVRATVAKGFGMFGGQKGYDLLLEQKQTEEDPTVLSALRPYVQ